MKQICDFFFLFINPSLTHHRRSKSTLLTGETVVSLVSEREKMEHAQMMRCVSAYIHIL
jgi:hypothetical protein